MKNDKEFFDLFKQNFKDKIYIGYAFNKSDIQDKIYIGYAFNKSDIQQYFNELQNMFKDVEILTWLIYIKINIWKKPHHWKSCVKKS